MRFNLPVMRRLSEAVRKRDWFGIGFELFVVVLGVVLGVQASRWTAERDEREYRHQMLASLDRTLRDYEYEGGRLHNAISRSLEEYQRKVASGERPVPPTLILPGLERAPTRAWEAMAETGFARSVAPAAMFRLALLFDRADSWGQKYQRYNLFTEQHVGPFKDDPAHFYGADGKLKPAFAAHIQQLDNLRALTREMSEDTIAIRRLLRSPNSADETVRIKDLPIES